MKKKIISVIGIVAVALIGVTAIFIFFYHGAPTESNERDYTERFSARVDRVQVQFEQKDYTQFRLKTNDLVRKGEMNTERGYKDDPDATVYILNWQKTEGERMYYVRLTDDPTHLYVLDSNRDIIRGSALTRQ